jgi:malate synthase
MLVRNVGHHMTNRRRASADGARDPEGIIDAVITGAHRHCMT